MVYGNRDRTTKHCRNPKKIKTILLGQKLGIHTDLKDLTCKNFNTGRVLLLRLILEYYGPDIENIKGEKKIVAEELSILLLGGNQKTTHKCTYQKETVSEINDIEEIY